MSNSTIFTDTGALVPADYGDPVARVSDLKGLNGNSRPALQASTALRPVYGRAPLAGRRNRFVNMNRIHPSGQGSASAPAWRVLNGSDITKEAYTFRGCSVYRTTAASGAYISQDTLYGYNTGDIICVSAFVKPLTPAEVRLAPFTSSHASPDDRACAFTFPELTQTQATASITAVEDDFYRVEFSTEVSNDGVVDSSTRHVFGIVSVDGNPIDVLFAGYSVEFIDSKGANRATPVQNVENDFDVVEDGAASPAYLRFDLSDDKMTHTFPNGFTGDVMLFGRNGSWVEENVTIAPNGGLDIGPRAVTGGIPGTLDAIGDVVGWLPVGRTLSAQERQYMVDYYKERGAKGLLVPGPELSDISDGFSASGKMLFPSGDWEVVDGRAVSVAGGGNASGIGVDPPLSMTALYFYRAATNRNINRRGLGGPLSGHSIPVRETPIPSGGLLSEGISRPLHTENLVAIRLAPQLEGDWIDFLSLRELRPQEEW